MAATAATKRSDSSSGTRYIDALVLAVRRSSDAAAREHSSAWIKWAHLAGVGELGSTGCTRIERAHSYQPGALVLTGNLGVFESSGGSWIKRLESLEPLERDIIGSSGLIQNALLNHGGLIVAEQVAGSRQCTLQ
ncbi:hypothetical protein DFH09DRAFT_1100735 [Mycena vulgaris]|nr:hypothetical protein DFH09DRAFT_1100735 [Mycena vulgaris]